MHAFHYAIDNGLPGTGTDTGVRFAARPHTVAHDVIRARTRGRVINLTITDLGTAKRAVCDVCSGTGIREDETRCTRRHIRNTRPHEVWTRP